MPALVGPRIMALAAHRALGFFVGQELILHVDTVARRAFRKSDFIAQRGGNAAIGDWSKTIRQ